MAAAYGAGLGVLFWAAFKGAAWVFDTGVGTWCRWQDRRAEEKTA